MNHNIYLLFERSAALHAERHAFLYEGRRITYSELIVQSLKIAALLRSLGVRPGDRVLMFSPNAPEYLSLMLGAAHAGAVFAPINDTFRVKELTHILANAGADVAFVHASSLADFLANIQGLPQAPSRIVIIGEGATDLDERIVGHLDTLEVTPDHAPPYVCAPQDECLIVYTSGSTAAPKGVLHSHGSVAYSVSAYAQMWEYRPGDCGVVTPPMPWVFGLLLTSAAMLTVGATVVLLRRFHPERTLEAIEAYGATLCFGTMSMYTKMLDVLDRRDFDLSSLRFCMVGGEPCPDSSLRPVEARFKRCMIQAWAFSENHPLVTMRPGDVAAPRGTAGKPAPGVEIRILDMDGHEVADGSPGEAWVRGPGAMLRYNGNPELTAEKVRPDGWIRTGDLLVRDAEGYLYVVGRASDMIIRSGANIAPAEVETALLECDGVAAACVVGIPDQTSGEATIAFVVRTLAANIDAASLVAPLASRLARYKIPQEILFLDELPLTTNGKIDRARLKREAIEALPRYSTARSNL